MNSNSNLEPSADDWRKTLNVYAEITGEPPLKDTDEIPCQDEFKSMFLELYQILYKEAQTQRLHRESIEQEEKVFKQKSSIILILIYTIIVVLLIVFLLVRFGVL